MDVLIVASACLILYSYLAFPVILFLLTRKARMPEGGGLPRAEVPLRVGIICAMYNEEKVVREKIENFLAVATGSTLYIGSDGSTDLTNELLGAYKDNPRIKVFLYPRRGKVFVLNDLMGEVSEEIVVFTDANSIFESQTLPKLLEGFSDMSIGAVCGYLRIIDERGDSGEGLYWRYETAIKKMESLLHCLIGANGSVYAVRRKILKKIPENTINDDFLVSMRVIEDGYGVLYSPEAVASERSSGNDRAEFRRHVRDGAGHYRAVLELWRMLNPLQPKRFFLYVSHRLIRWIVPFLLLFLLAASLLYSPAGVAALGVRYATLLFMLLAFLGVPFRRLKIFYLPFYFCYINFAIFIGFFWNFLNGKKVMWNTERV